MSTAPYQAQDYANVEQFIEPWGTEKLAKVNTENWDRYLTQALAAMRLFIHEASILSPYYTLFGRDVVWPVYKLVGNTWEKTDIS